MSRTKRNILIGIPIIVVVLIYIALVVKVNFENPKIIEEKYKLNETFSLQGFEIRLIDSEICNYDEMLNYYKIEDDSSFCNDENDRKLYKEKTFICNKFRIKKIDGNSFDYSKILLENKYISGANVEYPIFAVINNSLGLDDLEEGEEVEYYLPFAVHKDYYKKDTWENIKNEEFSLVFQGNRINNKLIWVEM